MLKRHAGIFLLLLRSVLLSAGLVLLLLALLKASAFDNFQDAVVSHGLIPEGSAFIASGGAVGIEILIAVTAVWGALGGATRGAWGAAALTLLLLGFVGYATALVINPPPVPVSCGCIPNAPKIDSWGPVVSRNGWLTTASSALTLGFVFAGRIRPESKTVDHGPSWSCPE